MRSSPAASGTTPSNMDSGSESDSAPEELTAVQGVEKHDEISKVEKDSAIRCVPLYPFVPCVYARLDDWMDKHSADCASLILICVVLVSYMII
jgi:hypothetical protein